MKIERHFTAATSPDAAAKVLEDDATLLGLFPDARVEVVAREGDRRTLEAHYTALGQEGTATFHFTRERSGNVSFEKVCDGRVWKQLSGSVRFAKRGQRTRVTIEAEGRTKGLVPEFTIKGPLTDQIQQMADALEARIAEG